jgi:hypothetical protein
MQNMIFKARENRIKKISRGMIRDIQSIKLSIKQDLRKHECAGIKKAKHNFLLRFIMIKDKTTKVLDSSGKA